MDKIPLTADGAKKMQQELDGLKKVKRPQIIKAIAEARAHGDLKENAEYHAAKEHQGMVEAKIKHIESTISNAQIIDQTQIKLDSCVFGATVTLYDLNKETQLKYQIVGDIEADIKQNKISINSPVARALIGKNTGDDVEVQAPIGLLEFEIEKIEYK
ncbi:MAG: transcription elongation factor GreA [Gammaproteobacteria bacterium]|nr:MAG: transcription elongation factor GreA [Gammaproteobacteria bacterium]